MRWPSSSDERLFLPQFTNQVLILFRAGKIKHLGLSEISVSTLCRAHSVHSIAAVHLSPCTSRARLSEDGEGARRWIIACSPFGRGFVTEQYVSQLSPSNSRIAHWVTRRNLAILRMVTSVNTSRGSPSEDLPDILKLADDLKEIGKKYDTTAGQVALVWVLAQGGDVIPIPGTIGFRYVEYRDRASQESLLRQRKSCRPSRRRWMLGK